MRTIVISNQFNKERNWLIEQMFLDKHEQVSYAKEKNSLKAVWNRWLILLIKIYGGWRETWTPDLGVMNPAL